MRDMTNLSWPEGPFGGAQRPFGHAVRLVTAVALSWTASDAGPMPVGTAVAYLNVWRTGKAAISDDGYAFGFRATFVDGAGEVPELVALTDRALVRARRHAVILAGHDLDRDLTRLQAWSIRRLAGVTGVGEAWRDRATKGRGLAQMLDTKYDRTEVAAALDPPLITGEVSPANDVDLMEHALAIGLTAACRFGLIGWSGSFRVREAIADAAWDLADPAGQVADKGDQA